jgi:hypothetical protein
MAAVMVKRAIRHLACVVAACALAACSAQTAVRTGVPASGSSLVIDGGLKASVRLGATATNVIAAGAIVSILAAGNDLGPELAPMKEDRTINVQDCTRPIANPTANLMCR